MSRPAFEVADIVQDYGTAYVARYGTTMSPEQQRVLGAIRLCRTAAFGGHKTQCEHCGHEEISYNSCRNRHCPKCQGMAQAAWLEARAADLLEVPYFHVVFTLPAALNPLIFHNPRRLYNLLFHTAAETLLTVARDPQHLGADIGFLAVLHTWGQTLQHHPHLHCVVPGGGLSPDGSQWRACRPAFFLPVRILSRVFRRLFLTGLRQAYTRGTLAFHGRCHALTDATQWQQQLHLLQTTDWVVYAKPPFGGPQQVLKYLARYTHRIAISNRRLVAYEDGRVTFRWKDYAHGQRQRLMTLDAVEFLRRFLLHVLPTGLQRIRHYGFLANRVRQAKLVVCRRLLPPPPCSPPIRDRRVGQAPEEHASSPRDSTVRCPVCQQGRLCWVARLAPQRERGATGLGPVGLDTS